MKKMNKKKRNALVRKMIVLIQLITLLGLAASLLLNHVLPVKYIAAAAAGMFGLWLIFWGMQFLKSKIYLLGVVLSIFLSVVQFTGIVGIEVLDVVADKVKIAGSSTKEDENEEGGMGMSQTAEYDADTLLVVAKNDSGVEGIQDVEGSYLIVHDIDDSENADKLIEVIENETGSLVDAIVYDDILDTAWALLDDEVQAVAFQASYMSEIEEEIEGYSSKIKIIYSVK